jgi:hypothetical protein
MGVGTAMKKLTADQRIKKAMRARENWVLREARKANRSGLGWNPETWMWSVPLFHALDRLREAGRIKFYRRRWVRGYWINWKPETKP